MLRIITELRPSWIVAENVPALRTRGADTVLEGLEELGYTTWPVVVGVDDCGGPHRRKRVFLVGYAASYGAGAGMHDDEAGQGGREFGGASVMADADRRRGRVNVAERGTEGGIVAGRAGEAVADSQRIERGQRHGTAMFGGRSGDAEQAGLGGINVAYPDSDTLRKQRERAGGDRAEASEPGGGGCDFAPLGGCGRCAECLAHTAGVRLIALGTEPEKLVGTTSITGGGPLVADADDRTKAQRRRPRGLLRRPVGEGCSDGSVRWPAGPGQPQHDWEEPRTVEFEVGSSVDGVSSRLVRAANKHALRCYGNSVSPVVAEVIGRAVMAVDKQLKEYEHGAKDWFGVGIPHMEKVEAESGGGGRERVA